MSSIEPDECYLHSLKLIEKSQDKDWAVLLCIMNVLRLCDVAVFREQMFNTPPKPNRITDVQNMQSSRHIAKPLLAAAAVNLVELKLK